MGGQGGVSSRSVTKSETIERFSRQQNSMLTQTHFTDFKLLMDYGNHCEALRNITVVNLTKYTKRYEGIR